MRDQTISLGCGRTLAFTIQGPDDGYPVFYLHGSPGSRHEPLYPSAPDLQEALCIVAVDRPGYGGSSPCGDYRLTSQAEDIVVVAGYLGIERFAVMGFSAGGLFALGCASALGQRVARVVLVSTPAPRLLTDPLAAAGELTRNVWQQARDNPSALPNELTALTADAETLTTTMLQNLPDGDLALMAESDCRRRYGENMAAAVQQGTNAAAAAIARDCILMNTAWEFDLRAIGQPVHIFHGSDDGLLAKPHAYALAEALPAATLELGEEPGHYPGIYGNAAPALWRRTLPG